MLVSVGVVQLLSCDDDDAERGFVEPRGLVRDTNCLERIERNSEGVGRLIALCDRENLDQISHSL